MATGDKVNNPLVEGPCAPEADGVLERNVRVCGVKSGAVKRKRRSHKRSAERNYKRLCFRMERLGRKHGLCFDPNSDTLIRIQQFNDILDSLFCPNPKGELTDDRQNERHLLFEQMRRFPEMIDNPSVREFLKKNLPEFSRFDKSGACDSNKKRSSPKKLLKDDTSESSSVKNTEDTSSGSESSAEAAPIPKNTYTQIKDKTGQKVRSSIKLAGSANSGACDSNKKRPSPKKLPKADTSESSSVKNTKDTSSGSESSAKAAPIPKKTYTQIKDKTGQKVRSYIKLASSANSGACDSNKKRPSPKKLLKDDTSESSSVKNTENTSSGSESSAEAAPIPKKTYTQIKDKTGQKVRSYIKLASSDKYGKSVSSNDRSSRSESRTENKHEPNAKKLRVAVKRSLPESSDGTEPVKSSPKLDVRRILSSDQFPNAKQAVVTHANTSRSNVSDVVSALGLSPRHSRSHNETRRDQETESTSDSSSNQLLDYDDQQFKVSQDATLSRSQMTEAESVGGSQNTKCWSEDSSPELENTWLMAKSTDASKPNLHYTANLNDDCQSHTSEISIHGGFHTQSVDMGTFSTHPDGPVERSGVSSQMGESRAQSWNPNSHSAGPSTSNLHQNHREINSSKEDWQNKYYVNWDEPTFFNNENSHGVYFQDDNSFEKALNWTNQLYETLKETPVGILKKPPLIEDHIRKTAKEVKMFDATGSTLTLTQSTLSVIKANICPQYWKGESCDKTCRKKHKMNCDEFPSVSPDEVFRAISARLMEMERPPLEMVSSLIEWLAEYNESIKILSFSKILLTDKGFNVCTAICGVFIKHLSTYFGWQPAPVVEYFLKFHYLMMKDNDHLKDVINRLICYCQVGTYRHKVYGIVRFLLGVKGYSLPFQILDKLLHEVNNNPPSDITMFKDKIKHQLISFEKSDDPNFRARAHTFLRTYFSESSSVPQKVD